MQADKLCRRYVCAASSASDDENSHALLERLLKTRDIQQPVLLTEALKIYIPQAVRLFTTRVRTRRRLGGRQSEYIASRLGLTITELAALLRVLYHAEDIIKLPAGFLKHLSYLS